VLVCGNSPISSIDLDPQGRYAAVASHAGLIAIFDLASGKPVTEWQHGQNAVTGLSYAPDGEIVASSSTDGTVKIWNSRHVTLEQTQQISQNNNNSEESLMTQQQKTALKQSNTQKAQLARYKTKSTPVTALQFTPRNVLLAGGVFDAESTSS